MARHSWPGTRPASCARPTVLRDLIGSLLNSAPFAPSCGAGSVRPRHPTRTCQPRASPVVTNRLLGDGCSDEGRTERDSNSRISHILSDVRFEFRERCQLLLSRKSEEARRPGQRLTALRNVRHHGRKVHLDSKQFERDVATRSISLSPAAGSGKNCRPCWQITESNESSSSGRSIADACVQRI